MTNEEAIIVLENCAFMLKDGTRFMKPEHEAQFREAYGMGIKALERKDVVYCKYCVKSEHGYRNCPFKAEKGSSLWREFDYHYCSYGVKK